MSAAVNLDSVEREASTVVAHRHLDQFAALHAALDRTRQDWQHDILMTAAVDVLARRAMTTAEVAAAINDMWLTQAITEVQAKEALLRARELCLVESVQAGRTSPARWRATDGGRRDTEQDRAWAQTTMEGFARDLAQFLDLAEHPPAADRHAELAYQLVEALAQGCAGVYAVDVHDLAGVLRPLRYEADKVQQHIERTVHPRPLRAPLKMAALAAMDPTDPFGDEVVHLLIVGSLIRGVLGRHDLPAPVSLAGVRIMIDTSVLVDLAHDGSAEREQLVSAIETTIKLGGKVIVARHTLDELERLWVAADDQKPSRINRLAATSPSLFSVSENPFVKAYAAALMDDPDLPWARFQLGRRSIEQTLRDLDVEIRNCPASTTTDVASIDRCRSSLSAAFQHPARRSRGRNAIDADARSLSMLVRWRTTAPHTFPAPAYFLARDSVMPTVYRKLNPQDDHTLVVNPEGFLLFASRLGGGNADEALHLADVVGRSLVRESFLGMATGFTVDDALDLAELLTDDGVLEPIDVRTAVQLRLEETFEEHIDDRARVVGIEVIRRRTERRDARARRAEQRAEAERASLEEQRQRIEADTAEQIQLAQQRAERRVAEAHAEADSRIEQKQAAAHDAAELTKRVSASLFVIAVVLILIGATWAVQGIPTRRVLIAETAVVAASILGAIKFCTDRTRSWRSLLLGGTIAIVLAFLPSAFG